MGLLDCDGGAQPHNWCPATEDDALPSVLGLLPQGAPWAAADIDGSVQNRFWRAIANVTSYAYQRLCDFPQEFHCSTIAESRDQWMTEYGLPDDCDPSGNNLCVKVTMKGGQDCDTFVEIARNAGWVITCEDIAAWYTNYAGCFEVGCTHLGPAPVLIEGSNLAIGEVCGCEYGPGIDHPEPEYWEFIRTATAHCPVPGSNLGETSGDSDCCFIVGYYDPPLRNNGEVVRSACDFNGATIQFECPVGSTPSLRRTPCGGEDVRFLLDYGGSYHWRVHVDVNASYALRGEPLAEPDENLSNAGNFEVGCTPLCSDEGPAAFLLCFLEQVKPAHTVMHTNINVDDVPADLYGYYLATEADRYWPQPMERFDPRFWTVNFPRPCNASVTTASTGMRAECALYNHNDLAGLIWQSEDTIDHPLLAYETNRDYSGLTMSFNIKQTGLADFDSLNGAVLTINGRDASSAPKTWYVRLWNYATGTSTKMDVVLDFDNLVGGFSLPADADPVYPFDIDDMLISMVSPDYVIGDSSPLSEPCYGTLEITELTVSGSGARTIKLFNATAPSHGLKAATGYDDSYNITPERLLRNIRSLGYSSIINHYVGMSHYSRLTNVGGDWIADSSAGFLNPPCVAWHNDFLARAKLYRFDVILSLSFELLNENCPPAWRQYDYNGNPALTGWTPPSTLLSITNQSAQAHLHGAAKAFCSLAHDAGLPVRFQIGEPWWWVHFTSYVPNFYDASTTALYTAETGLAAPAITDMRDPMNDAQKAYLDWLGEKLGQATLDLRDAVKAEFPNATTYLLFYAPQVQASNTPELHRVNRPAAWSSPAFDVLQLEDYDFVIDGDVDQSATAASAITNLLGYPAEKQDYFSGFVLNAVDAATLWPRIVKAAEVGVKRGANNIYIWAMPQIMRDGLVVFKKGP